MLHTHPYVRAMHIEQSITNGNGADECVLVVETQLWWPSEYSVSNDNGLLDQFEAELHWLERQMQMGQVEFSRIELRPVN